jgi:hypothetical protein
LMADPWQFMVFCCIKAAKLLHSMMGHSPVAAAGSCENVTHLFDTPNIGLVVDHRGGVHGGVAVG